MTETINWIDLDSKDETGQDNESTLKFVRTVQTMDQFRERFHSLPSCVTVFILLICSSIEFAARVWQIAARKQDQLLDGRIEFTAQNMNLPNNSMTLCFVSKSAMIHKIKSNIVKYLDKERVTTYNDGLEVLGVTLSNHSERLAKQLCKYNPIKGCHVLLIPLNVTEKHFLKAYSSMEYTCKKLAAQGRKYVIHTLDDYFGQDSSNETYSLKRYKKEICQTIMDLSLIRIYIVGKELYVSNEWSRQFAALELNINHEHQIQFVERCSFIAAPNIDAELIGDLCPRFGQTWQSKSVIPKSFDIFLDETIQNVFSTSLQYAHDHLPNREREVNSALARQSPMNSRSNSPILPDQQAEDGPAVREPADGIRQVVDDL